MMNKEETIENFKKIVECETKNAAYCLLNHHGCDECVYMVEPELYEETLMSALMLLQKGVDTE